MKKDKTYRVKHDIWQEVCEKNIEWIAENNEMQSETKMINAIIMLGLQCLKDKEKSKDLEQNLKLYDEIN
jgi:hypothetical protein